MNVSIVIAFVVGLFVLSIFFLEDERNRRLYSPHDVIYGSWGERTKSATEGLNFKEGMEVVDSLWDVIQAINLLEDNYFILLKRDWFEYENNKYWRGYFLLPESWKGTIEMSQYGKPGYLEK